MKVVRDNSFNTWRCAITIGVISVMVASSVAPAAAFNAPRPFSIDNIIPRPSGQGAGGAGQGAGGAGQGAGGTGMQGSQGGPSGAQGGQPGTGAPTNTDPMNQQLPLRPALQPDSLPGDRGDRRPSRGPTGVRTPRNQQFEPGMRHPDSPATGLFSGSGGAGGQGTSGNQSGSSGGSAESTQGPTLRMTQTLNTALVQSPRVASVRAQLNITKSQYWSATETPNPVLFRDEAPIAEQSRRMGVQSTYDPPWKVAFRLLVAKRQVKQTKLEILNTLWQFRADVRRAYTEVVVAQETMETLNELRELASRLLEVSQKRFQAGDVPELDVLKARLANSQVDIDIVQGLRRVDRAKQQLNVIMGANVGRQIVVPRLPPFQLHVESSDLLPDFSKPVPPMPDLIEQALANRLELRIIRQQIAVANAQLYNAVGNIIPDPVIATGSSRAGNPPTGPLLNAFFVSLQFELPVLTFSQGDISRLRATIRQLYAQQGAQRNLIVAQVSSAYNNLLAARERIRVYQDHVLSDSAEVARLARRSYEVGQSDITSTIQAQQANVQIRTLYLNAVQEYQQAFTDLEQSVGEPLQ